MLQPDDLRSEVTRAKSAPSRGMGRGLAAILSVSEPSDGDDLRELPVDLIAPNPNQPRKAFEEAALQALADSIAERGLLQPVLVRPLPGGTYELVAGERRWRAARLAGLEHVPALVRTRDDAQALEVALIENMAREDLNPRVGRSRVAVSNLLRLLDLPDEAIALIEAGDLSAGHGRALLLADDHDARRRFARTAVVEGWSVRVLEERARDANAATPGPREGGGTRAALHPDQEAAVAEIAETLGGAFGTEVRVRPKGARFRVELELETIEEAVALAARLGPR